MVLYVVVVFFTHYLCDYYFIRADEEIKSLIAYWFFNEAILFFAGPVACGGSNP